ncbi:peptidase S8, partial [Streptomyces sp. NPDC059556]
MTSRTTPFDRGRAALIAAGVSLVMLSAGQTAAAGTTAPAVPDTFKGAAASTTVTLVTGDRVTLSDLGGGQQTVTVDRAKGATGAIRSQIADGRVTVVPDEARPYLASGALDPRLFDVTGLVAQGITGDLPLIVTYGGKGARTAAGGARGGARGPRPAGGGRGGGRGAPARPRPTAPGSGSAVRVRARAPARGPARRA